MGRSQKRSIRAWIASSLARVHLPLCGRGGLPNSDLVGTLGQIYRSQVKDLQARLVTLTLLQASSQHASLACQAVAWRIADIQRCGHGGANVSDLSRRQFARYCQPVSAATTTRRSADPAAVISQRYAYVGHSFQPYEGQNQQRYRKSKRHFRSLVGGQHRHSIILVIRSA